MFVPAKRKKQPWRIVSFFPNKLYNSMDQGFPNSFATFSQVDSIVQGSDPYFFTLLRLFHRFRPYVDQKTSPQVDQNKPPILK